MKKRLINEIKKIAVGVIAFAGILLMNNLVVEASEAEKLDTTVTISNGGAVWAVTDGSYSSSVYLYAGDTVTVTVSEGIQGIYLIWDEPVNEWTLECNGESSVQGSNGFLHDYIELDGATEFVINNDKAGNRLADIYCYGEGELPADVQIWEPMCEKADILLLSSHADDEILFFGSVLAQYAGQDELEVQVVYFSQYWTGAKIREHEKLDGIWHAGVRNYPFTAHFDDWYAGDFERAKTLFGYDNAVKFAVEMIRRFKPQVIVGHDLNGEYGHGTHILTAHSLTDAVTLSNDAANYPESAEQYGVHEVKKLYLHLYGENKIKVPTRVPLDNMGGKTALEVAKESYLYHVSQQWCWYYVDDEYEYSCADFGLYYTTVGYDTGNDMMENIIDYKTQEEMKKAEEEAQKKAEEESIKAEEESSRQAASLEESKSIAEAEKESVKLEQDKKQNERNNVFKVVIIVLVSVVVIMLGAIVVLKTKSNTGRKKRKIK